MVKSHAIAANAFSLNLTLLRCGGEIIKEYIHIHNLYNDFIIKE